MTLAVILGLWCTLASSSAAASAALRVPFVQAQAAPEEPAAQAPAKPAEPEPQQAAPQPAPQPSPPPSEASPQTPPADATAQKPASAARPAATKPKKRAHKKKPPAQPADPPAKVVVRNGSTSDPNVQLSPTVSKGQTSNQIESVNQLLAGTDSNLKQISGRTLNPTQQDTVKQIHLYMDQARKAVDSGDVERGRNLAFKAHLLCDDLVKH